jgi:hypothetical protein
MNCPECNKDVELVTKTNQDTGMAFNQWECSEHGKVDPTQKSVESSLEDMYKEVYGSWKYDRFFDEYEDEDCSITLPEGFKISVPSFKQLKESKDV